MSKKKEEVVDPNLSYTEIEIGGKIYKMCLDHEALCRAETALIDRHPEVNLLYVLPVLTGNSTRILFAMSLGHFHPEIAYEDALKLVNRDSYMQVANAVSSMWHQAMPEAAGEAPAGPR